MSSHSKRRPINRDIRKRVINKYHGRCGYCGEFSSRMCIDHIEPLASSKGSNEESNLMPACGACNNYKSVLSLDEFRNQMQMQVDRCEQYSVNFRFALKFGQVKIQKAPIVFYFEKVKNA